MSFITWLNSEAKKLDVVFVNLIKLSTAGFVLMIVKLWQPLLGLDWYWYGLIFVLAAIGAAYRIGGLGNKHPPATSFILVALGELGTLMKVNIVGGTSLRLKFKGNYMIL